MGRGHGSLARRGHPRLGGGPGPRHSLRRLTRRRRSGKRRLPGRRLRRHAGEWSPQLSGQKTRRHPGLSDRPRRLGRLARHTGPLGGLRVLACARRRPGYRWLSRRQPCLCGGPRPLCGIGRLAGLSDRTRRLSRRPLARQGDRPPRLSRLSRNSGALGRIGELACARRRPGDRCLSRRQPRLRGGPGPWSPLRRVGGSRRRCPGRALRGRRGHGQANGDVDIRFSHPLFDKLGSQGRNGEFVLVLPDISDKLLLSGHNQTVIRTPTPHLSMGTCLGGKAYRRACAERLPLV